MIENEPTDISMNDTHLPEMDKKTPPPVTTPEFIPQPVMKKTSDHKVGKIAGIAGILLLVVVGSALAGKYIYPSVVKLASSPPAAELTAINTDSKLPTPSPETGAGATPTPMASATPKATVKPTAKPTTKPTSTPTSTATATPQPTTAPTPTPTAVPTTGTIEGRITKDNGQAAQGATVDLSCDCSNLRGGAAEYVQADANGHYTFTAIKAGSYRIQAEYGVYSPSETITVEAGKTLTKNFTMNLSQAVPQSTILSGPALRQNQGDPANLYCATVQITASSCCGDYWAALTYDNPSDSWIKVGECASSSLTQSTYMCAQLNAGSHTFYYKANNNCGEEAVKSVNFTVN